ncbi:MAG: M23 family metallopeptidase, partial [Thermomicrobiaceae bacterium]|nr:M23 family metallopeptidase [Thermomicrobiaceae bacterium]
MVGCRGQRRSATRLVALVCIGIAPLLLAGPARAAAPFGLPLGGPPGPSTWYVSQWYGGTVWAYRNWPDLYSAGQGLHFGIDFATPCGTDVLAIGDGVVFAVDGPYGAAPHNVVIDHGNGYLSLYGHLRERASLRVGQRVARGQPIAHSGDPASPNCDMAPHLHLEIRRTGMRVAVNPVPLIAADWRWLTIGAGTDGTRFTLNYGAPGAGMDYR